MGGIVSSRQYCWRTKPTSSSIGLTVSSKIMFWSAAWEKTRSKLYERLLMALGPIDSSTFLPLTVSVLTTTLLFSRTSRSLRPRHRTTTLMFVSSTPGSKSRSLRFVPMVFVEAMDAAGDTAPARSMRVAMAEACLDETVLVPCLTLARLPVPARRLEPIPMRLCSRSERVWRWKARMGGCGEGLA